MSTSLQNVAGSLSRHLHSSKAFTCLYASARQRLQLASYQRSLSASKKNFSAQPSSTVPFRNCGQSVWKNSRQVQRAGRGPMQRYPVGTGRRGYKTVQEMRSKYKFGVRLADILIMFRQFSPDTGYIIEESHTDSLPSLPAFFCHLRCGLPDNGHRHGILLSFRERADGKTADSGGVKGCWKAEGWGQVRACGPGWKEVE